MKSKIISALTLGLVALSSLGLVANSATLTTQQKTEIKQQMEQIKQLPKEQRKAKIQDLKTKYPEAFKHRMGGPGKSSMRLNELAKANPQLASEIEQVRKLPKDQRKAKMMELKKKYPGVFKNKMGYKGKASMKLRELAKANPQLASEIAQVRKLPKEQRRAKMSEIKGKYLKG